MRRIYAGIPVLIVAAAAAASEGGAEPNMFAGGISNAIITLVIFGLVVAILGKFAWAPLLNLLNEREQSIRTDLQRAQQERLEAERLLHEYQQQLNRAREEATAIVAEGRRDAEAVKLKVQHETQQEADKMVARAKHEIQLATDAAIKQLYDNTAGLAVNVARGILKRELSADAHRDLVQRALDEMKTAQQASRN